MDNEVPFELIAEARSDFDAFRALVAKLLTENAEEHQRSIADTLAKYGAIPSGDGVTETPAAAAAGQVALRWHHARRWYLADLLFGLAALASFEDGGAQVNAPRPSAPGDNVDPAVAQRLRRFLSKAERRACLTALVRLADEASSVLLIRALFPMLVTTSAIRVARHEDLNVLSVGLAGEKQRALIAALLARVVSRPDGTGVRAVVSVLLLESDVASGDEETAARLAAAAVARPPPTVITTEGGCAVGPSTAATRTAHLESVCRQLHELLGWHDTTGFVVDDDATTRERVTSGTVGTSKQRSLPNTVKLFFAFSMEELLGSKPGEQAVLERLKVVNRALLGPAFAPLACRRPSKLPTEFGLSLVRLMNLVAGAILCRLPEGFFRVLDVVAGGVFAAAGASAAPSMVSEMSETACPTAVDAVKLARSAWKSLLGFGLQTTSARTRALLSLALVRTVTQPLQSGYEPVAREGFMVVVEVSSGREGSAFEAASAWLLDELIAATTGTANAFVAQVVTDLVSVAKAGEMAVGGGGGDESRAVHDAAARAFAWIAGMLERVPWETLFERPGPASNLHHLVFVARGQQRDASSRPAPHDSDALVRNAGR
jgi:hypothetical protein